MCLGIPARAVELDTGHPEPSSTDVIDAIAVGVDTLGALESVRPDAGSASGSPPS